MNLSEKFCRGIMKLSFRRGISQKLEYTYNGEKAMYETVLEKHRGWLIVFRRNPQRYILMEYTCLMCGHRISREIKKGRVRWGHFYATVPEGKSYPHHVCYCGCDEAQPPSIKEQEKARRRLRYWKRQFHLHRTAFFTGQIKKLKRGR